MKHLRIALTGYTYNIFFCFCKYHTKCFFKVDCFSTLVTPKLLSTNEICEKQQTLSSIRPLP